MNRKFNKPLIPMNTESLDGRTVESITIDLERGPLPVYSEDRALIGKVTSISVGGDGIVSATISIPGWADGALAAELSGNELLAVSITEHPEFVFEKDVT